VKRLKLAILLVIICFAFGAWGVYAHISAPTNQLNDQLRQVIIEHDTSKMKELSVDQSTEQGSE